MKRFLFVVCLLSLPALAQNGGVLAGTPTITNTRGEPVPFATVAICISNPGSAPVTPCNGPGNLATIYTDLTLGTLCTNNVNPPAAISGVGCTNPGMSDGLGNVVSFAAPGTYYCEYYGGSIVQPIVVPCFYASGSGGASASPFLLIPNCTAAGTVQNQTVQLSTQNGTQCATVGATGSTSVIGVCHAVCGNTGTAQVAYQNFQSCIMDNSGQTNDYISPSATVQGFCSDTGINSTSSSPSGTVETIGIVGIPNTGGAGNAASTILAPLSLIVPGSRSTGLISACAQTGPFAYYSGLNILSCDLQIFRSAPGIGTAQGWNFNGPGAGFLNLFQGTIPTFPPTGALQLTAPSSITPYQVVLPSAAGTGCLQASNASSVVTIAFTGTNCGTASGNFLSFTTVPQPSAPTLTNLNAAGARSITYVVVACQDTAGTFCTQASPTATIANANASPQVKLSQYRYAVNNGTSIRCWNIYVTADASRTTLGKIASCVSLEFTDTGANGDGTTAPVTNNTQVFSTPQPLPGGNTALGGVYGIDAPPQATSETDDEFTETAGFSGTTISDPRWTGTSLGTSSFTLSNGELAFTPQNNASDQWRLVTESTSATPWSYVVAGYFLPTLNQNLTQICGMVVFDGTKLEHWGWFWANTASNWGLRVSRYTNTTTFSAFQFTGNGASVVGGWIYFKVQNDGTNLNYSYSYDGITYFTVYSELVGAFLANTNNIGFGCDAPSASVNPVMVMDYFRRTQ